MSNAISEYLEELVSQKSALAANLTTMGVSASSSEKLNTLVPKVLEIEGEAVVQPLSVTQNGTYTPPSGVDGYAPVTVNVSGGSGMPEFMENSVTADILATAYADEFTQGSATWGGLTLNGSGIASLEKAVWLPVGTTASYALPSDNYSVTVYAIAKQLDPDTSYANPNMINVPYSRSNGNAPGFFNQMPKTLTTVYGSDTQINNTSFRYHALAMSLNNSTKNARFFEDGVYKNEKSYSNSGSMVYFGGLNTNQNGNYAFLFAAVVNGVESDATIIANQQSMVDYIESIGG